MGVDPALHDGYPFVYINGEKYHYGQEPVYGQWMVSHESYGKWYWCFDTEQEMVDFLENLPDSAVPPPDLLLQFSCGIDVGAEERERGRQEHRQHLRKLLEEKRSSGTTFPYCHQADGDK